MAENFDDLLSDGPLQVPDGFAQSVMARVEALPLPEFGPAAHPESRARLWLQGLILAASALFGAVQLGGFMFGIWAAATAV